GCPRTLAACLKHGLRSRPVNEEAMISRNFKAVAASLFLSAATVALSSASFVSPADAAARPAVGKLLQQAIDLAKGGSTGAANAKVQQAEGVGGLTPGDQQAIEQVKSFINA